MNSKENIHASYGHGSWLVNTGRSVSIRDHSSDAKCTLVTKCAQDEKHLPPSLYWAQNLPSFFILFTNTTLSTLLILAVCRTRVMWTSQWTLLTVESLWLSDRASEHGIRGTEVRFLIGTQNFFFVSRLWQDEKHLSPVLYQAQNLVSFLFYLQGIDYSIIFSLVLRILILACELHPTALSVHRIHHITCTRKKKTTRIKPFKCYLCSFLLKNSLIQKSKNQKKSMFGLFSAAMMLIRIFALY